MRKRAIFVGVVAGIVVVVLLILAILRESNTERAGTHSAVPPEAAQLPNEAQRPAPKERTSIGTTKGPKHESTQRVQRRGTGTRVSPESWNPMSVEVPRWGQFFVDIIDLADAKPARTPGRLIIHVVTSDPPPHFAVRLRAAEDTRFAGTMVPQLMERLEVFITGEDDVLGVMRSGAPWTQIVSENGNTAMVHVLPFALRGLDQWRGETGERLAKIVVWARGVEVYKPGHVALRKIVLVHNLASPSLTPQPAIEGEDIPYPDNAEYALACVHLHAVSGFTGGSFRFYVDDQELPVHIVERQLRMDQEELVLPTRRTLNDATLRLKALVTPGWWTSRQELVVVFEVTDANGEQHSLKWEPDFD